MEGDGETGTERQRQRTPVEREQGWEQPSLLRPLPTPLAAPTPPRFTPWPHLPLIWISCPFLSHLTSASGSASSTLSRILWPLLTW